MTILALYDESSTGEKTLALSIDVDRSLTVEELIRSRVKGEVDRFNSEKGNVFRGLIQPTDTEKTLNGYILKERRKVDPKEQADKAVKAFTANGFFLLVDDQQVTDLTEVIIVTPDTTVSFFKLMPLIGG